MRRRSLLALLALVAAVAMMALAACGDDEDSGGGDTGGEAAAPAPEGPTIRLRGADFSEQATIAEVYGQYLQAKGYDVEILTPAGQRAQLVSGLRNGDLDMIVDYIGGSQAELAPDADLSGDPEEVVSAIEPLYADFGFTVLEYSPATDADAFVVRGDAEATTISDVADLGYRLGAAAECFERPQCFLGLTDPDIYGIEFADRTTIEFGPLLGEALAAEEVDAVIWNTTAPQIEAEGFKVLEDDKRLFPAQNIAPIIRTEVLDAYGEQLATDLNDLSAQITTEDLVAWNTETDLEQRESDAVAEDWLTEKGLLN
jgi:osmoprotectant transport system substrate-binding protein